MSETEKILKKHRHRIPLSSSDLFLIITALSIYKNTGLTNEILELIRRLEKY